MNHLERAIVESEKLILGAFVLVVLSSNAEFYYALILWIAARTVWTWLDEPGEEE